MKTNRTSVYMYNKVNEFPRFKKTPHENEVWLVLFPYEQLGNMEQLRPALIKEVKEDTIVVQRITTNKNKGKKIKGTLSTNRFFNKPSYLNDKVVEVPIYKLYGKLKHRIELEEE